MSDYDPRRDGNLVELMVGHEEGGGFNQPCAHGNLVVGHSVYCHNSEWADAPRKFRRTWYTGGMTRDEDCEGFKANSKAMLSLQEDE